MNPTKESALPENIIYRLLKQTAKEKRHGDTGKSSFTAIFLPFAVSFFQLSQKIRGTKSGYAVN